MPNGTLDIATKIIGTVSPNFRSTYCVKAYAKRSVFIDNRFLNVKVLVGAFNKEKAFSMIMTTSRRFAASSSGDGDEASNYRVSQHQD